VAPCQSFECAPIVLWDVRALAILGPRWLVYDLRVSGIITLPLLVAIGEDIITHTLHGSSLYARSPTRKVLYIYMSHHRIDIRHEPAGQS